VLYDREGLAESLHIPLRASYLAYVTSRRRVGLGVGKVIQRGQTALRASLGATIALGGDIKPSLAAGLSVRF